jgi:hypothetical protein
MSVPVSPRHYEVKMSLFVLRYVDQFTGGRQLARLILLAVTIDEHWKYGAARKAILLILARDHSLHMCLLFRRVELPWPSRAVRCESDGTSTRHLSSTCLQRV